jgi:mannose-6-phosphate isomerase-like protein (cupin superfamily)
MAVQVFKRFFKNRADVLDDLKLTKFWPTTFVSGPSPGLEVHWHSEEVHAYVLEGETSFLDAGSGERHPVAPGDKIVVPPRTLHAEGEVRDRTVYIIAVPEAMLSDEFLKLRPPEDL